MCYAFEPHHGGPSVAAGFELAVALLGGKWGSRGYASKGFRPLEDALNHLSGLPRVRAPLEEDDCAGVQLPVRFAPKHGGCRRRACRQVIRPPLGGACRRVGT